MNEENASFLVFEQSLSQPLEFFSSSIFSGNGNGMKPFFHLLLSFLNLKHSFVDNMVKTKKEVSNGVAFVLIYWSLVSLYCIIMCCKE